MIESYKEEEEKKNKKLVIIFNLLEIDSLIAGGHQFVGMLLLNFQRVVAEWEQ